MTLAALGLVTITAYGSWFYGFGVLVSPITEDTGWSTGAMGLTFGVAQVITGAGAFVAGRLLDRFGGAGPFLPQAVLGGGLLLAATWAGDVVVFGALYSLGAGIVGATGFYHVTTVAASRSGGPAAQGVVCGSLSERRPLLPARPEGGSRRRRRLDQGTDHRRRGDRRRSVARAACRRACSR